MKKILFALFGLLAASSAHAFSPVRQVQISTNTLTKQLGAFNVTAGTMTTVAVSTINLNGNTIQATAGTRTYTVPDATANANFLMSQGTAQVDASTTSHSGGQTFNTITVATLTPTNIVGVTGTSNAPAGDYGEYASTAIARSVGKTASTGVAQSVSTMTLTAGDWNISICGGFKGAGTTSTDLIAALSTTANTLPAIDTQINPDASGQFRMEAPISIGGNDDTVCSMVQRLSISGSTTFYLVQSATFSVGSVVLYGGMWARRVR